MAYRAAFAFYLLRNSILKSLILTQAESTNTVIRLPINRLETGFFGQFPMSLSLVWSIRGVMMFRQSGLPKQSELREKGNLQKCSDPLYHRRGATITAILKRVSHVDSGSGR